MIDISSSGRLIGSLWRLCCEAARLWIPLARDVAATEIEPLQKASAKLAGRWPDAATLLAHRTQSLKADGQKAEAHKADNDNQA